MTRAEICATREAPRCPSFYRAEQYDSDLGLYYLRARYYNRSTGTFMSRDPEDGKAVDPRTLHKYLYAGGDPVNASDPRGSEVLVEGGSLEGPVEKVIASKVFAQLYCRAVVAIFSYEALKLLKLTESEGAIVTGVGAFGALSGACSQIP